MGTRIEQLQELMAQSERARERDREESERVRERNREEMERIMQRLARAHEDTERTLDKMSRKVDRLSDNIGGLSGSIGEIVELVLLPGVLSKMNELGHNFTIASPRKQFSRLDGSKLTEVDLLLENCDEVLAVEVKTQFSIKWVERHLKRLELLRTNQAITGMTGRTIYAAAAGMKFDTDAIDLAVTNGIYLIEINEDDDRITIKPPEAGKVGKW